MFKFRVAINLVLSIAIGIPSQGILSTQANNSQPLIQIDAPVTGNIFLNAERGSNWIISNIGHWFNNHSDLVVHPLTASEILYTSPTVAPTDHFMALATTPTNPLFAFMVYHDSLGGLSIVAADGSHQHQIRTTGDKPVWANFGDRLAFIDKDVHGVSQIFTMNESGASVIQITQTTNGVCGLPSWSPNDNQLLYGVINSSNCDLYVTAVLSVNTPQRLMGNLHAFTWLTNNMISYTNTLAKIEGSTIVG